MSALIRPQDRTEPEHLRTGAALSSPSVIRKYSAIWNVGLWAMFTRFWATEHSVRASGPD
jgi:hypothetical protein